VMNIKANPLFADKAYRLSADSPCIDAGDNSVLDPPGFDLDGHLRIAFGRDSLTVDMGAYEYNSLAFVVTQVALAEGSGCQLVWNSQPTDSYTIWSCSQLSAKNAWKLLDTIQSEGETTTWTDPDTPTPQRLFYRIEID